MSALGQPFEAVIPFTLAEGEFVTAQCMRAHEDAPSPHAQLPLLANARLEVAARAGGGDILVRTRAPVGEPAVRLRILIDCGLKTVFSREFVVLLDAAPAQVAAEARLPPAAASPVPSSAAPSARTDAGSGPAVRRGAERRDGAAGATGAAPAAAVPPSRLRTSLRVLPEAGEVRRAAPRQAASRRALYRLTLSRPGDPDGGGSGLLNLRRSETLAMVDQAQPMPAAEQDRLRALARLALAEDPVAEAVQMQSRLAALETGMAGLKKQVGDIDAARAAAEQRTGRLAEENKRLVEENRRLASRLTTFLMIGALLLLIALAAAAFWRYRLAAERRVALERAWAINDTNLAGADFAAAPPPVPARPEPAPGPAATSDAAAEAASEAEFAAAQYQRTVVLDRSAAAPSESKVGTAPPEWAAPASTPAAMAPPAPGSATSAPAAPKAAKRASTRPDSAVPMVVPALPMPGESGSNDARVESSKGASAPDAPLDDPTPEAGSAGAGAGPREEDLFLPLDALADGPEAQEEPALPVLPRIPTVRERTLESPAVERAAPLPNIDERPMAEAIEFSFQAAPSDEVPGGADTEGAARARRYLEEYERKMFPEIALGRVKLSDPRSIIALARTYYLEDFDPAKAISFLEYALNRSSDPMRIHLALLEVLRLERRVRDYARVARAFRGHYPDSGTHWQLVAAYGRLLDPAEALFSGERVPGLDIDTPSNWLGNTMDMTKYVLGQKVADSVRDLPAPAPAGGA